MNKIFKRFRKNYLIQYWNAQHKMVEYAQYIQRCLIRAGVNYSNDDILVLHQKDEVNKIGGEAIIYPRSAIGENPAFFFGYTIKGTLNLNKPLDIEYFDNFNDWMETMK